MRSGGSHFRLCRLKQTVPFALSNVSESAVKQQAPAIQLDSWQQQSLLMPNGEAAAHVLLAVHMHSMSLLCTIFSACPTYPTYSEHGCGDTTGCRTRAGGPARRQPRRALCSGRFGSTGLMPVLCRFEGPAVLLMLPLNGMLSQCTCLFHVSAEWTSWLASRHTMASLPVPATFTSPWLHSRITAGRRELARSLWNPR